MTGAASGFRVDKLGGLGTNQSTPATSSQQSSSSSSGGVPDFPYQSVAPLAFTTLLVVSYLVVRGRTKIGRPAV